MRKWEGLGLGRFESKLYGELMGKFGGGRERGWSGERLVL